jgi:hypothetical protein
MNKPPAVDWADYVDTMAALHGLELDAGCRAQVVEQMKNIERIVSPLLEFPLDAEVEPAPVFRP